MKLSLYTIIVFCALGLLSCRKSSADFTIKQYDDEQIQNYIKQNNLTGFKRDTTGGDTSGIYYQIVTAGTGAIIQYSDKLPFVYTVKSFDGGYNQTDTIENHAHTYAAYVSPTGLQLALLNIIKHKGSKVRLLIPSRLAYGTNGSTFSVTTSTGATTTASIAGNQCLDYGVNVIDDDIITVNGVKVSKQAYYDDASIQSYLKANSLTNLYKPTGSGLYYRVIVPGTGDVININSVIGVQYTGNLFNGIVFDSATTTDGSAATIFPLLQNIPAWQEGLQLVKGGAQLSLICPSRLCYGSDANTSGSVTLPAFSCLRFDITVVSVAN